MKITYRKPEDLLAYPQNTKIHTDYQIAKIKKSIEEFGFNNPILVDDADTIIAGHGRVMAAMKLDIDVPTISIRHLTPDQIKAYRIADNKLAEMAEWDNAFLQVEFGDLLGAGFDATLTGFSDAEIADLLAVDFQSEPEDDDCPNIEDVETRVQPGDLFRLGDHLLWCGDTTDYQAVKRIYPDEMDMCFTDPPYGVDYQSEKLGGIKNDKIKDMAAFIGKIYNTINSCICDGGSIYLFHPIACPSFHQIFQEVFVYSSTIIWSKNAFSKGRSDYHWQHEPCIYGWKRGASHKWFGDRSQTTIWDVATDNRNSYVHPTQKPVELAMKAIRNSCPPKGAVFEPFCGSGSTLIACENMNVKCRAIELDPKYCDVILARWEEKTGGIAERVN